MYNVIDSNGILKFRISDKSAGDIFSGGYGVFSELKLNSNKVLIYSLNQNLVLDSFKFNRLDSQLYFWKGDYIYKEN